MARCQPPKRVTGIAEHVFTFAPFAPDPFPENWKEILRSWLLGEPLAPLAAGNVTETLQFIEGGLVYRLPWAMEAVRVRATANGDVIGPLQLPLADFELGVAVTAVETGTLNRSAALLMQAGFTSRLGAIKAVQDGNGAFTAGQELQAWLATEQMKQLTAQPDWPTAETKPMWLEFVYGFVPSNNRVWDHRPYFAQVEWLGPSLPAGSPVGIHEHQGQAAVLSADGLLVGWLQTVPPNPDRKGIIRASVSETPGQIDLTYLGPDDLWQA